MSLILVIGGYGGFGARIADRLAGDGHHILVAGRSLEKATRFCAGRIRYTPLALDREDGVAPALARLRPAVVVDASGPFQGASYALARACIAAGCHYVDIADGRDFVVGIGALDADARAAGVSGIAGASSVPALSGAVVRSLASGIDDLRAVEIAISASNRATAGVSVTTAILSYVGRPLTRWHGRRWAIGHGWQSLRRERFEIDGVPSLGSRLVGLADVPDLDLLPRRLPHNPAVTFRAGTELALHNLALRAASHAVRAGLLTGLDRFAPILLRLQRLTSGLGSDRSGMIVRLFGLSMGRRIERRWTLIATDGTGPEIPGLAVPLLVERILTGRLAPGAGDAGELLVPDDFEAAFRSLGIRHQTVEVEQPPPLYARVMGAAFDALPPSVRRIHDVLREDGAHGRAVVTRGKHPLARLAAAIFGFPAEGEHDLHVTFEERDGAEVWTRDFSGRAFQSRLSQRGPYLVERFGPFRFGFRLEGDLEGLTMHMSRWWIGPIPLPLMLAPRSAAREWEEDRRFNFDVPIALPLAGMLVHYRGWLERPPGCGEPSA